MTHQTQRIAYPYFVVALLLFGLQVLLGLWLATQYFVTVPQGIVDVFPFSTARAMHTNLLVLWLLLGFMGATYYLVPEETGTELACPRLAIAQLVLLVAHRRRRAGRLPVRLDAGPAAARDPDAARLPGGRSAR